MEGRTREEREQRISNGSHQADLPKLLLLVIRRHILWVETGRVGGTDATREKNPQKKGRRKEEEEEDLSFDHRVLCVCGGHQKSGHANRGESEWRFHIPPSPPSLEVTARHCKHERIFLLFFYFFFYFYFIFSASSPGTRRVDVRIGRP